MAFRILIAAEALRDVGENGERKTAHCLVSRSGVVAGAVPRHGVGRDSQKPPFLIR